VGPRTGLNAKKNDILLLQGLELLTLGCPASSQPLYRLRYPGSLLYIGTEGAQFTSILEKMKRQDGRSLVDI
jgi:hypothetical protein